MRSTDRFEFAITQPEKIDVTIDETIRGKEALLSHLSRGRRDSQTRAEVFSHPDGHPDLTGPGQPAHHAEPHVHGMNAAGQEIVIPYSGPSK